MEIKKALYLAQITNEALESTDAFTRVEIAGSIRREKPDVGDIEIVVAPKFENVTDMFGEPKGIVSHLTSITDLLSLVNGEKYIKNGERYKQILLCCGEKLDLFIVHPPAQWGVIYTIRTGPWQFSKKIVTPEKHGGYLRNRYAVKEGAVWEVGRKLETPEEIDFFNYLTIDYLEPKERQ